MLMPIGRILGKNLTPCQQDSIYNAVVSTSRLAYWRTRRGLTQEQLAALAGVTQAAVSQMERAQRAPKGLYSALRLAAACGTTVEAIWPDARLVVGKSRPTTEPQHRPNRAGRNRTAPNGTARQLAGKSKR